MFQQLIGSCLDSVNSAFLLIWKFNAEVQDELLMLLRSQQRELTELRGQIETMQSSIMAQVEHVLTNHQEQERILQLLLVIFGVCLFIVFPHKMFWEKCKCLLNHNFLPRDPWPVSTSDRRLERVLAESQNHQQQLQEHLGQQLGQALSSALTNRMDKVLRDEMKKTVPQSKKAQSHHQSVMAAAHCHPAVCLVCRCMLSYFPSYYLFAHLELSVVATLNRDETLWLRLNRLSSLDC